jgi:NPCBM/NEW2 domain/Chitobiase/beta-hexosaminidase C-terminal domain
MIASNHCSSHVSTNTISYVPVDRKTRLTAVTPKPFRWLAAACLWSLSTYSLAIAQQSIDVPPTVKQIEFELQTRDPATGAINMTREKVDSSRVGVIAVDVWNYHWCKTATMRVDAFVPRINKALEAARSMGMTVMLCPSDVVDNYVGFPQREAVLALPTVPVPKNIEVTCPPVPDAGGCACGRERCGGNYGWDSMHPGLQIGKDDLMPDTQAEVYTICQQRKITHLIYVGFHTQVCLLGKPMGLRAMKSTGLQCVLARDMTDAHPGYDPARNFTPDLNTEQVVEHFEKHLAPTIHFQNELVKLDLWDSQWVVDPVRIAPWGTDHRPHLFEEPITVTLTAPLQADADIRYTADGSEPTSSSTLYQQPLVISESTRLRVSAFKHGRAVCQESIGNFARMGSMPDLPDVYLGDLQPLRSVGFGHTYANEVRYSGDTQPPQKDKSNRGGEIRINRQTYTQGLGVHAPCEIVYEMKPEYQRFVGLAGVDEYLISRSHGSNLAMHPSLVFKVYIDGHEAAKSPVMRILSPAWRFDVAIPRNSKKISVIAMTAGDGNREDYADWANAGFIVGP